MCPARSLCTALRPSILKPSCAHRPRLVLPQHNLSSSIARCLFVLLSVPLRGARGAPGYPDEITGRAARRPPREEALAPRALPLVRPCHPDEVVDSCAGPSPPQSVPPAVPARSPSARAHTQWSVVAADRSCRKNRARSYFEPERLN